MMERFKARSASDDPEYKAKQAELVALAEARTTRLAERKAAKEAEIARVEAERKAAEEAAIAEARARAIEERAAQKAARDAAYAARKARKVK
jgi:Family of unknown function (DUF6481)